MFWNKLEAVDAQHCACPKCHRRGGRLGDFCRTRGTKQWREGNLRGGPTLPHSWGPRRVSIAFPTMVLISSPSVVSAEVLTLHDVHRRKAIGEDGCDLSKVQHEVQVAMSQGYVLPTCPLNMSLVPPWSPRGGARSISLGVPKCDLCRTKINLLSWEQLGNCIQKQ